MISAEILERLPTRKAERWKYTDLPAALKDKNLEQRNLGWSENVRPMEKPAPGADTYADTSLWDINRAHSRDIKILNRSGIVAVHAKQGGWYSPSIRMHVPAGQSATLVERQTGEGAYWKNAVTEITLERDARLTHLRFIEEGEQGTHTHFTHITCDEGAAYEGFSYTAGAGLTRNQIHAQLNGAGASCTLNGLNLLSGKQHADTTITIEHGAERCTSSQFYRTLLAGQARGVFQGKIHVHPAGQKTDGYQLSNTLLLSPQARMDTKPELEIYADDVKCSHGATTGALDEGPLFYMQSRGIPRAQARKLLIRAFIGELVDKIVDETVRHEAEQRIERWLDEHAV